MKCLVIGNGYLGNQIAYFLNGSVSLQKINNQEDANQIVIDNKPTHVINCAGKTGTPNIDWCEANKQSTFFANVVLPTYILNACQSFGAKMIHIGSGCVYQGGKEPGYTEEDAPNFFGSYYSWTKVISERFLQDYDVLQLRIRMPLSDQKHPRNLLTKLLGYSKVINAKNSITYIPDMLCALKQLIEKDAKGIYNIVNPIAITHEQILGVYEVFSGKKLNFQSINKNQLNKLTKAPRSNCILSCAKLSSTGIHMPNSIDSVKKCVQEYLVSNTIENGVKI